MEYRDSSNFAGDPENLDCANSADLLRKIPESICKNSSRIRQVIIVIRSSCNLGFKLFSSSTQMSQSLTPANRRGLTSLSDKLEIERSFALNSKCFPEIS